MWLPEKKGSDNTGLSDGCYGHPVVILSPEESDGKVVILIVLQPPSPFLMNRQTYSLR